MPPTALLAGRYRVLRRLGSGGAASVVLAEDQLLGRDVAVKRVHGAEVTEETALRLRREAKIMASLRHPNLVGVFDMLMDGDDLLLVMEYVEGDTLADLIAAGPLDPGAALAILEPVAAALQHAHGRGVVHRDVKPSNVLVGRSGVVKLADLGLATAAEITRITPPGSILGTPAYMAPEQARPGRPTPAADVFSLATVAYEALSGVRPRTGRTALEILNRAAREPPPDLRDVRPDTPAAVADALIRGMSAKPSERQASAPTLVRELADAFAEEPAGAPIAVAPAGIAPAADGTTALWPRPNRRTRALAIAALAASVLAVVIVALVLVSQGGERPRSTPAGGRPRAQASATATATATARRARPTATATAAATAPPAAAGTPAGTRGLSPTATVRAFYTRAASGDFAGAWRLAGPRMRAAFGNSLARFTLDLSSLRRIDFRSLAISRRGNGSVTVAIETVAVHTNRVDHCSGTLQTVKDATGSWVVEPAGVTCRSA